MAIKGQVQQRPGSLTIYESARNAVLNMLNIDQEFEALLDRNDVGRALMLMDNHDVEVEQAMSEYEPESHYKVMKRPNKARRGKEDYESNKLPLATQKRINEIELFFLLDKPIEFKNESYNTDIAFEAFLQVLKDVRFDSHIRQIKRTAGAITECAHYWRVYKDNNEVKLQSVILSASNGYSLRPMFDQYGTLLAFAWQYQIKDGTKVIQMTEIETNDWHYVCSKQRGGWVIEKTPNLTGKINVIYYRQDKAWEGAQRNIERLEMINSKIADVNDYFAAPKLIIHSDMLDSLPDSTKIVGEVIQYEGNDSNIAINNLISYLEFPTAPELQKQEIASLEKNINIDTLTPNFDYDALKGLGTLSGAAIQRAMQIGYLKRNLLLETYEEMISREISLITTIMKNITHIRYRDQIERMQISFAFADPYAVEDLDNAKAVADLYQKGVVSIDTAIEKIGMYTNFEDELSKLTNTEINNLN